MKPSPTATRELFAREVSIVIAASREAIFDYVVDITRHPEWAANPLEIQHVAGPARGVGATFTSVAHRTARIAGTFTGRVRVLVAERPDLLRYEVIDTSGHYHWTITLATADAGTLLTQHMAKLDGPWLINVVQPSVIWPLVGSYQARVGLARLKARMETPLASESHKQTRQIG